MDSGDFRLKKIFINRSLLGVFGDRKVVARLQVVTISETIFPRLAGAKKGASRPSDREARIGIFG
jgi:hypothetical protein